MKNGNLYKEKKEYIIERFKTKSGIIDFLIGSAIWGFIIVNYTTTIFDWILTWAPFKNVDHLNYYIAYLVFGMIMAPLGLLISYIIQLLYNQIRGKTR